MNKRTSCFLALIAVGLLVGTTYVGVKVVQYKTYIWLPYYFQNSVTNNLSKLENGHVIFLIADHHEPGHGERGVRKSRDWCEAYRKNIEGIHDDFGNPVQYTWFYPYDHLNSAVVLNLNGLVFEGLGEVEFQWHHGPDTNETFPAKLKEALAWFNSHGCLLPVGENAKPQFGFVHGNWGLDNSRGDQYCGVNRELDILKEFGCYADFTFATLGTEAQPAKVNSIYYAKDTDESKSYDKGGDARVGTSGSGLMIFQGPISCDWKNLRWDCAAFETTSPFKPGRAKLWLKYAPTVKGRPEWLFVKVYTHGVQSRDVVLSGQYRDMLLELKRDCRAHNMALHFVTAREAYNMVRAVEDGKDGNPEDYRDYVLKKPINRLVRITEKLNICTVSEGKIEFEVAEPKNSEILFKMGAVSKISGFISRYSYRSDESGDGLIDIGGKGTIEVQANEVVMFRNDLLTELINDSGKYIYTVKAR
jgi:hypothetical protein